MLLKRKLRNALNYYKHHLPVLDWLLDTFELNDYEYAIVGGFVKDIVAYVAKCSTSSSSRDLDIVVNIPRAELELILNEYRIKRFKNDFGGFKLIDRCDATFNIDIDIWCLEDHQPFKSLPSKMYNWKGFRESGWLNVCGAVYLPQSNKLYAKGLKKAIKQKDVRMYNPDIFLHKPVINKYMIVAKIIDYLYKGYSVDVNCIEAMKLYFLSHTSDKTIIKYLEEHSTNTYVDWSANLTKLREANQI